MKNWQDNETFLLDVEKPTFGGRYCPINHEVFIREIQQELYKNNMNIVDKKYLTAQNGLVMCGEYQITSGDDTDMNLSIVFQNSFA